MTIKEQAELNARKLFDKAGKGAFMVQSWRAETIGRYWIGGDAYRDPNRFQWSYSYALTEGATEQDRIEAESEFRAELNRLCQA